MSKRIILSQARERLLEQAPVAWRDSLAKYKSIGYCGNVTTNPQDFGHYYNAKRTVNFLNNNFSIAPAAYVPAFSGVYHKDKTIGIKRREHFKSLIFSRDLEYFLHGLGRARGCTATDERTISNAPGLYISSRFSNIKPASHPNVVEYLLQHELRHMASDWIGIGPFCEFWPNIDYLVESKINPLELIAYGTWRNLSFDSQLSTFITTRFKLTQEKYRLWKNGEDFVAKTKALEDFLDELSVQLFGKSRSEALKERVCIKCKKHVEEFSNETSQAEYLISGLCQECQVIEAVFEEDDNGN